MADVENPRLSRIKEKTLWRQFKILHTPGKKQLAAALYKLSVTVAVDDDDEDFLDDYKQELTTWRLECTLSLKAWGVRHHLSSYYLPHSNCIAEIAVTSVAISSADRK